MHLTSGAIFAFILRFNSRLKKELGWSINCIPLIPPHFLFPSDLAAATHMDDEYVWAGVEDPKIVVTTSHDPSSRLKQFAKVRGAELWQLE